jgi:DNA transformation protein and related proteins
MTTQDSIPNLRNLGPKSMVWLANVGIHNRADLETIGTLEAFRRLWIAGHKPSLLMLYALHGALHNCDWQMLEPEIKLELQAQANLVKKDFA